eukprot:superscaffoldBa00000794_g7281
MMDALSVVSQLRDLASEPQNRDVIVQDEGCLPGLVLFLDHKDPEVLFATLQDQRGLCEEALLKVKGVISFTFQMASKRCTVRIRSDLPTESLASAIAATKVLSAQQVVKNEAGEEVFIPLSSSGVEVQQNTAIPDYLPEEEENQESEVDRAISRTTAKDDSNGSWLSSAASFLTKTFYW